MCFQPNQLQLHSLFFPSLVCWMRLLVFSLISSIKAEDNQWNQIERFDGIELAGADGLRPITLNSLSFAQPPRKESWLKRWKGVEGQARLFCWLVACGLQPPITPNKNNSLNSPKPIPSIIFTKNDWLELDWLAARIGRLGWAPFRSLSKRGNANQPLHQLILPWFRYWFGFFCFAHSISLLVFCSIGLLSLVRSSLSWASCLGAACAHNPLKRRATEPTKSNKYRSWGSLAH